MFSHCTLNGASRVHTYITLCITFYFMTFIFPRVSENAKFRLARLAYLAHPVFLSLRVLSCFPTPLAIGKPVFLNLGFLATFLRKCVRSTDRFNRFGKQQEIQDSPK